MMRTVAVFTHLFLYMIFSLFAFPLYPVLLLLGMKHTAYRYVLWLLQTYSRTLLFFAGAKVTVRGRRNIPTENSVCFISNHQGMADILVLVSYTPKIIGFITKKELKVLPGINLWMKIMNCIYIDRSSIRQAVKVIEQGARYIRKGRPLAVFPEGTRSRSRTMGPFKRGSIKLALRSEALIVPVTIDGSYKLYEQQNKIRPGHVILSFHPPIDASKLSNQERKQLSERLYRIIEGGLQ